jgi:hypothetical protein
MPRRGKFPRRSFSPTPYPVKLRFATTRARGGVRERAPDLEARELPRGKLKEDTSELGSVWQRATDKSACRLLQYEFKEAKDDEERALIYLQLRSHVWDCIKCGNANHALQLCISYLPPCRSQFVIDEISATPRGILRASCHRFGCRVIERLIENGSYEQNCFVFNELLQDAGGLSLHAFGNYVFQTVLEKTRQDADLDNLRSSFLEALRQKITRGLPRGRYFMPMIELALQCSDDVQKHKLIWILLELSESSRREGRRWRGEQLKRMCR